MIAVLDVFVFASPAQSMDADPSIKAGGSTASERDNRFGLHGRRR